MKKTISFIIFIILLSIFIYIYFFKNQWKSSNNTIDNFSMKKEEISKISKIVITESVGGSIELIKKNDSWYSEDNKVRPENIENIFEMLELIKIQNNIPINEREKILTMIASKHKKVEIYLSNKSIPSKVYYVGNPTVDRYGTYMMVKENKDDNEIPYITHIPGFNGYLTARFHINKEEWKFTGIFTYKNPKSISKIEYINNIYPNQSYNIVLENQNINNIKLYDFQNKTVENYDTSMVKEVLLGYKNIHYNRIYDDSKILDSLMNKAKYFARIKVTDNKGIKKEIKLYTKNNSNNEFDATYCYTIIDNKKILYLSQLQALDPILIDYENLLK